MAGNQSIKLFEQAQRLLPGGVNSPVRAFRGVGGDPLFLARGKGARVWDADGREYIDYVGSWGPLIVGHAHPEVLEAIRLAAESGTTFGAPTELEVRFAEAVRSAVPSLELLRCVSSGTEATMSALRLARGFTGRHKIIKVDGAYHGHADFLLAQAGSGAATLGIPGSAGVPPSAAQDTIVIPWNDEEALREAFSAHPRQIAAVIVEPIPGNMGVVPPKLGYLHAVREVTRQDGALLIFDEVITGFRVALGGAQALFGIKPDLTCLGKIIGGGLPAACFGGRKDIMEKLAPLGPVYQAGTLSGNPLAMAAGAKTLEILSRPGTYERLEKLSVRLEHGLREAALSASVPTKLHRVGSMLTAFFTDTEVTDYTSAKKSDTVRYGHFFRGMLSRGVYLAPSQFEAAFVSLAHSEADIDKTVEAAADSMRAK
ncbi:MAG: glutamate-1-semialdehyde 2,1-aminomutase [Deltaproteobacteria bacterium]|nr:glutamate-1-semialdehyde 2,1-aminomutase [Deltaproteobacteria bacterium]